MPYSENIAGNERTGELAMQDIGQLRIAVGDLALLLSFEPLSFKGADPHLKLQADTDYNQEAYQRVDPTFMGAHVAVAGLRQQSARLDPGQIVQFGRTSGIQVSGQSSHEAAYNSAQVNPDVFLRALKRAPGIAEQQLWINVLVGQQVQLFNLGQSTLFVREVATQVSATAARTSSRRRRR